MGRALRDPVCNPLAQAVMAHSPDKKVEPCGKVTAGVTKLECASLHATSNQSILVERDFVGPRRFSGTAPVDSRSTVNERGITAASSRLRGAGGWFLLLVVRVWFNGRTRASQA